MALKTSVLMEPTSKSEPSPATSIISSTDAGQPPVTTHGTADASQSGTTSTTTPCGNESSLPMSDTAPLPSPPPPPPASPSTIAAMEIEAPSGGKSAAGKSAVGGACGDDDEEEIDVEGPVLPLPARVPVAPVLAAPPPPASLSLTALLGSPSPPPPDTSPDFRAPALASHPRGSGNGAAPVHSPFSPSLLSADLLKLPSPRPPFMGEAQVPPVLGTTVAGGVAAVAAAGAMVDPVEAAALMAVSTAGATALEGASSDEEEGGVTLDVGGPLVNCASKGIWESGGKGRGRKK